MSRRGGHSADPDTRLRWSMPGTAQVTKGRQLCGTMLTGNGRKRFEFGFCHFVTLSWKACDVKQTEAKQRRHLDQQDCLTEDTVSHNQEFSVPPILQSGIQKGSCGC